MSYGLLTPDGVYTLNATFRPQQNSVGGAARARMVGGFGSGDWFRVEDGFNEPAPFLLVGQVFSDRDDVAVRDEREALEAAVRVATRLIHDDVYLELDGGAQPLVVPVEPSLWDVTLALWASEDSWRRVSDDEAVPF